ncbi:tRNA-specific adenosine deaminase subunit tad3 [Daldinia childiae]|uniref:tRNA-specific adenosine deaminase subunit tad3 n=1 Tax=Daldinia childiae TaxID=326645 RepID=UPI00144517CB|nr:tRNA-specific adenosine deaminase subunit tad3 [Daldinia childiae]KAF3070965.1 tRNA-specific adenosine deaminase subunit tad3 [Daldinia childiae]
MSDSMKEVVEALDPVSRHLIPPDIALGTLVPLKTILELRDNLSLGLAYVTRAPNKVTNDVVNIARALAGDDAAKNLPHLRRCVKPADIPPHLKTQFMNEGNGRQVHLGKSNWLYIVLGPKDEMSYDELVKGLANIDDIRDDIFIGTIPVPLLAPTSQVQANMWSQQFWQTVYRKNNPLGPHPSTISRTEAVVSRDASVWMTLAHQIAKSSQEAGYGEPIGAVIVKRTIPGKNESGKQNASKEGSRESDYSNGEGAGADGDNCNSHPEAAGGVNGITHGAVEVPDGIIQDVEQPDASNSEAHAQDSTKSDPEAKETTQIVAIAADARWHQQEKMGRIGNPMAHAAVRAISMVAQKLVRAENRPKSEQKMVEFEAFQDKPLLNDEQLVFDEDHPCPDGYLCHELELYMTHEPCTMCAMAILHSRMGRIVFRHRMPLTGGMSSEDRGYDACGASGTCGEGSCGGGQGLGLHWRKELNWTLLGWEWESDRIENLPVDAHLHA